MRLPLQGSAPSPRHGAIASLAQQGLERPRHGPYPPPLLEGCLNVPGQIDDPTRPSQDEARGSPMRKAGCAGARHVRNATPFRHQTSASPGLLVRRRLRESFSVSFSSLGLKEPILRGVRAAGYETPTDIQADSIPKILAGSDLIGLGETGSGKTAAFGLPMLDRLCGGEPGLRGVILVPTRELCVQVAENLRTYARYAGLHVCTAFGGVDLSIQESAFKRGIDVVVACPGRLIDHLERRNLTLEKVEMVVLDEADRMLDMGFMPQIRRIFVRLPQERQNLLFSATMPQEVEGLVKDFLPHAERVQIGSRNHAPKTISHRFVGVNAHDKQHALDRLLHREHGRVLIFVNKKIGCERLGSALKRAGLPADAIHGDKSAEARHACL